MFWSKIEAKIVLAVLFNIHLLKRILFFWKRHKGLATFFEYYGPDAIFPVDPGERSAFPSYERCQACSLCTFSCRPIQEGRAPSAFEPKMILQAFGRSSHESEFFLEEWVPCLECDYCTIECPNHVPVHGMARQIVERRKRVGFRS